MSAERRDLAILRSECEKGLAVAERIAVFADSLLQLELPKQGHTQIMAICISDALGKYYTCMETIFLRISQFFENSLPPERWHAALLERMTLASPEYRPRVLTDATARHLGELLRFRHFNRYYYDFAYDWPRLESAIRAFEGARSAVRAEVNGFLALLAKAAADVGDGAT